MNRPGGSHEGAGYHWIQPPLAIGTTDGYLVTAGVIVAIARAIAALHRRHPVPTTVRTLPARTRRREWRCWTKHVNRRRYEWPCSEELLLGSGQELAGPSVRPRPKEQHV
jgi:hypothetical protein